MVNLNFYAKWLIRVFEKKKNVVTHMIPYIYKSVNDD